MRIYLLALILICSTGAHAIEVREKDLIFNMSIPYNFTDINIDVIGENEYFIPLKIIEKEDNISIQNGTIYKYFDAWIGTYRVKKAIIRYKVNNSWIEDNNIVDIELLQLNKTSKEWEVLDRTIIDEDDSYTYLESETEYLSSFVIIGLNADEDLETITLSGEIEEIEITEDDEDIDFTRIKEKARESSGFEYYIVLIITIFVVIYIKTMKDI